MALAFNVRVRRRFFYPICTIGKFVERLRPEEASQGIPRQNKRGVVVYEKPHDAIGGKILAFTLVPPNEKVQDPQYQLVFADPADPLSHGYVSFGQNTSLGRQLVNQLLSLTPPMLSGVVTLTLRVFSRESEKDFVSGPGRRNNIYLNLYRGPDILYHRLVPRRFTRDEIPPPQPGSDGKWDFTPPNEFFRRHAVEFAEYLQATLPHLPSMAVSGQNGGAVSSLPSADSINPDPAGTVPDHVFDDHSYIPEYIVPY